MCVTTGIITHVTDEWRKKTTIAQQLWESWDSGQKLGPYPLHK
jgi:hypothetical protein